MDNVSHPPAPYFYDELSPSARLIIGVTWPLTAFAILAVALRFYLRPKFNQSISIDDWIMLLGLSGQIVFQIFLTLTCISGLGYSITFYPVITEQIVNLYKWSWWSIPFNTFANVFSRISIAIILVQIFGIRRWFKQLVIFHVIVLAVLGTFNFVYSFVQISPLQATWDSRIEKQWELPVRPQNILIFTQMIIYALSDFLLSFFPVFFIWKLNLATRKKIGLIFFMTGSLISMGLAIARAFVARNSFSTSTEEVDPYQAVNDSFVTYGTGSFLSSIEISFIIILGSLPKLKLAAKLGLCQGLYSYFHFVKSRFSAADRTEHV